MKTLSHLKQSDFRSGSKSSNGTIRQGFALIATISVMVLLVMIALAMLSLSTLELRQSSQAESQAVAQANARMGLMLAIGELQKYAGPDTRVTANASVANESSPNPYWVEVYKTRPDEDLSGDNPKSGEFVAANHEHELYLTDIREGKKSQRLAHLVSGHSSFDPDIALSDDQGVVILDTGEDESSVSVPLVNAGGSRYAYWVSDNSVKALYNHANPHSKEGNSNQSASKEEYYGASVAQAPNLDDFQIGGSNPFTGHSAVENEVLGKGITLNTSRLILTDLTAQDLKKSYHSITGDSAAVFSNPITGGLKFDLTAFIENGEMTPTGADANINLPPLLASTPIIKGEHHNMTSPRFGILKDWADMRFRISGSASASSIPPQVSADSFHQNFAQSISLKRRDLTKVQTNYIQPVVVEASLGWDFSPYSRGTGEYLRAHIFPRLILWNPYNVKLEARKYIMLTNIPAYGSFSYRGTELATRLWYASALGLTKPNLGNPQWSFPGFVTVPVSLEPGECKVFSPDMQNSGGTNLVGRARRFDSTDFTMNVLTPDEAPSSDNFYWDSNYQLSTNETPTNKNLPYGFSHNSNSFHGAWELASDEYMVLQSTSGITGSLIHKDLADENSYETVTHFLAQNNCEQRYPKWYAAQDSQHPANGSLQFRNITQWQADRLPPRLWRRGMRLQWFDESAEGSSVSHYARNSCRLTTPLVATANLHGGKLNHPSALGVRVQEGWQLPNMNGHLFFRQPTDPDELKSFFPPSPIGRPGDGYPERVVLFDVPRKEAGIFSMGQFQHAQYSYLSWHPSYILGSSYSTHQSDLDATALRDPQAQQGGTSPFLVTDGSRWSSSASNWGPGTYNANTILQRGGSDSTSSRLHGDEVLIYDIAYELNHSFWDHFMLSGIPHTGGEGARQASWDGIEPLPVSHYLPRPIAGYSVSEVADKVKVSPEFEFYHAAEFLLNHGALNVNCDNKEVWKAHLLSLKDKKHPSLTGGAGGASGSSPLTRSILPGSSGADSMSGSYDEKAWSGFRALSEGDIDLLAGEIVKQVRERGPFLSLSDFVNRRLNKNPKQNASGALQSAIDLAGINSTIEQAGGGYVGDKTSESATELLSITNRADYKTAGLPGYFSQNDLLTVLSPSLTARGDTFTIRAYGEARNKSGDKVLARAYCEAIVQRIPDYIDSADNAVEPVRIYNETSHKWELNESSGSDEAGLSQSNLKFGRRFRIEKFRWLSSSEV